VSELEKIGCFRTVDEVKSAFSRIKDLKKFRQRQELTFVLYKLSLLKEYDGLLENKNIKTALDDLYKKFIDVLKNKEFYFNEDGTVRNITSPLEIYNAGFIKTGSMSEAIERLHAVGYSKLYEREYNCIDRKLYITSIYSFEMSAKKYNEENNLSVEKETHSNEDSMYKDMKDFVYQINLINDLNKPEHRNLLYHIILKLTNITNYTGYMCVSFYRLIDNELEGLKARVKDSEYLRILANPKNKNNLENTILKEILLDSRDILSSLTYIKGILLSGEPLDEQLSISDIVKLNESSEDYFKHSNNKYRTLRLRTGV
jgi:hypothetical protein